MSTKETSSPQCVVNSSPGRDVRHDSAGSEPKACHVVAPVRPWMALGMMAGDVDELELDEHTLRAICEYARLDDEAAASDAVAATLKILLDEIREVDVEIEMLELRRRALHNRAKQLRKLECTFGSSGPDPLAD